jgi:hypothetical protein
MVYALELEAACELETFAEKSEGNSELRERPTQKPKQTKMKNQSE